MCPRKGLNSENEDVMRTPTLPAMMQSWTESAFRSPLQLRLMNTITYLLAEEFLVDNNNVSAINNTYELKAWRSPLQLTANTSCAE